MDAQRLGEDVRAGRVDAERLVDLIVMLQEQLQNTQRELQNTQRELQNTPRELQNTPRQLQNTPRQLQNTPRELRAALQQIAELQRKLGASPTPRFDQPYSLRGEERRQQDRGGSFETFVAGFARIQPCRFPRNS